MILQLSVVGRSNHFGTGYIAGRGDGIVTVAGVPSSRAVYLYALYPHKPMVFVAKVWSNAQGHYIFPRIDTNFRYLVVARDYAEQFEPFAWDYVVPATDLTPYEQYQLQQSWQ